MSNQQDQGSHRELELSPDDRRVLDAAVQAGFDRRRLAGLSGPDAHRGEAVLSLLGLLKDYPVEDADETLIDATLARIDRHQSEAVAHMNFAAQREGARGRGWAGRIRLPDFISVAAVVLIAVGVLWPILAGMRNRAIDLDCSNNMRNLAYAFSQYASDNHGALPMQRAGLGPSWDTARNALNLELLSDGGYCEAGHLNCPGHADYEGPSYSYRWIVPERRDEPSMSWGLGRATVVLGDLNPIIDAVRSGRQIPPLSMSINHAGRGQNVLTNDGATLWLQKPLIGGNDNIWLPDGAQQLRPGQCPLDPADVFLAQ